VCVRRYSQLDTPASHEYFDVHVRGLASVNPIICTQLVAQTHRYSSFHSATDFIATAAQPTAQWIGGLLALAADSGVKMGWLLRLVTGVHWW